VALLIEAEGLGFVDALKACCEEVGIDYAARLTEARGGAASSRRPQPSRPKRSRRLERLLAERKGEGLSPEVEGLDWVEDVRSRVLHHIQQAFTLRDLEADKRFGDYFWGKRRIPPYEVDMWRWCGLRGVSSKQWLELASEFTRDELELAGLPYDEERDAVWPMGLPGWDEHMIVMLYERDGRPVAARFRTTMPEAATHKALSAKGSENQPGVPYMRDVGWAAAEQGLPLVITEGEMDALCARSMGFNSVSSPGASSFKRWWVDEWRGVRRLLVLGDGDEAGERFVGKVKRACALRLGPKWCEERLVCSVGVGGHKDLNAMLMTDCDGRTHRWLAERLGWDPDEAERAQGVAQ